MNFAFAFVFFFNTCYIMDIHILVLFPTTSTFWINSMMYAIQDLAFTAV